MRLRIDINTFTYNLIRKRIDGVTPCKQSEQKQVTN